MNRISRHLPAPFTRAAALAAVVAVVLSAGCGKKAPDAAAPPASNTAAAVPGNQPVFTPPAAPTAVAPDAAGGVDLRQLNHAYIAWIVQSHQRPKTFEEFASASKMQIPPPPAGQKFVIDRNGFIALVKQ